MAGIQSVSGRVSNQAHSTSSAAYHAARCRIQPFSKLRQIRQKHLCDGLADFDQPPRMELDAPEGLWLYPKAEHSVVTFVRRLSPHYVTQNLRRLIYAEHLR